MPRWLRIYVVGWLAPAYTYRLLKAPDLGDRIATPRSSAEAMPRLGREPNRYSLLATG